MKFVAGYSVFDSVLPKLPEMKYGSKYIQFNKFSTRGNVGAARALGCEVKEMAPLFADRTDSKLAAGGFIKRVASEVPKISYETKREFRSFIRIWLRKYLKPLQLNDVQPWQQWLEEREYPRYIKNRMRKTYHDFLMNGGKLDKRHLRHKSFLKREPYPDYKWPRWIQGCCDVIKVHFGPFVHAMEKVVYALRHFVKFLDVLFRPGKIEKLRHPGHKYLGTDHTAFEAHVVPAIAEICEVQFIRYLLRYFPDDIKDDFKKFMIFRKSCVSKYGVGFAAARMSGDPWTSFGNSVTNLMVMCFLANQKKWQHFEGIVEGDDGLFTIFGEVPTSEDFAALGFDVKAEIFDTPEDAGFCHVHYVPGEEDILIDPIENILKFGWTTSNAMCGSPRVLKQLARAKCMSLLALCPSSPIVSSFARYIYRVTQDVTPRFEELDWWQKMKMADFETVQERTHPVTVAAREFVRRKWHVNFDQQRHLESLFDQCSEYKPIEDSVLFSLCAGRFPKWLENRKRIFVM